MPKVTTSKSGMSLTQAQTRRGILVRRLAKINAELAIINEILRTPQLKAEQEARDLRRWRYLSRRQKAWDMRQAGNTFCRIGEALGFVGPTRASKLVAQGSPERLVRKRIEWAEEDRQRTEGTTK